MIGTLILDLDGPIIDGRLRHYQCYSDILVEHGYKPMPVGMNWEMKRQRKDRHVQLAFSGADEIYK
jgi:phosphoglycolate phosphatase